jgi:hypothetical protein
VAEKDGFRDSAIIAVQSVCQAFEANPEAKFLGSLGSTIVFSTQSRTFHDLLIAQTALWQSEGATIPSKTKFPLLAHPKF